MTRVCLIGASGRMGALIRTAIESSPDFALSGAVVAPVDPLCGGRLSDIEVTADIRRAMAGAELVLDFSSPAISVDVAEAASAFGVPLLIGTTGHTPEQLRALAAIAPRAPLLIAPNTSIGVYALTELVRSARAMLGGDFDVEIVEIHHRGKVDAPSGTAKLLAHAIEDGAIVSRSDGGTREVGSIGVASLRGGDVPGEHTVYFLGPSERIELTHRVRDRGVFAAGALRLGRALLHLPAGRYTVGDVLSSTHEAH